ncbi:hypothetical protein Goshw_005690 [Gossypium schwendimanii]|uniref:Uncharacterized protein n=1 Tax=Gossypium schwendimanii TaxID=34291 RepID=A0A7J9L147_GOSSC|nr:hypothetical protein [Gossypium schwendimanii]
MNEKKNLKKTQKQLKLCKPGAKT